MKMVGQDHDGLDPKRATGLDLLECSAEGSDVFDEQRRSTFGQVDREKVGASPDMQATVVRHAGMLA